MVSISSFSVPDSPDALDSGSTGILSIDIRFLCVACGSKLSIDVAAAGRWIVCTRCEQTLRVPLLPSRTTPDSTDGESSQAGDAGAISEQTLSAELRFVCPQCRGKLRIDARAAGQSMPCVLCGRTIRVPVLPDWVHRIGARPAAPSDLPAASTALKAALLTPEEFEFLTKPEPP